MRHEGVSTKRYKLIRFYGRDAPNGEEWELYDLENDPYEMKSEFNNPEYAGIINIMKEELRELQSQYKVPDDNFDLTKNLLPNQIPKSEQK